MTKHRKKLIRLLGCLFEGFSTVFLAECNLEIVICDVLLCLVVNVVEFIVSVVSHYKLFVHLTVCSKLQAIIEQNFENAVYI